MGVETWVAMAMFSVSMSLSPGPVNMVILATGANHGVRRTLGFVSGATVGFTLLLIFTGGWLFTFIDHYPKVLDSLSVAGALFIVYVGVKIGFARPERGVGGPDVPRFMHGFWLQWLNPKAWMACASGVALFSTPQGHGPLVAFVVIYGVICYLSLAAWAVLGARAATLLDSRVRIRRFNVGMGSILIATACYMLYLQLSVTAPGLGR